jgi:hypothetical protein
VQDDRVTCGDPLGGGPVGSGNPFAGGCDFSAHANNWTLTAGSQTLNCQMEIADAQIAGDGEIGINSVDIFPGVSSNCDLWEPCLVDPWPPSAGTPLPWAGSVEGTMGALVATIGFCIDTPLGTFAGPITGDWRNPSPSNPPQIEFDNAPIGSSGATFDVVFNISPATLSVG